MSNAKRGIMVPVLTLAVCAIAMVGLGFALQTSVTSTTNDVNIFQVDLDDNESTLVSQKNVSSVTKVNGLLNLTISTNKNQSGENLNIEYVYDGSTFIKIFTNDAGYNNPSLSVSASYINGSKITAVSFSLYEKSNSSYDTLVAEATTNVNSGVFELEQDKTINANTVYKLVITGITTNALLTSEDVNEVISFTFRATVA